MPTTRKKIIKTVYKDEDESDAEGDFSDSGSEAQISEQSSSGDEEDCDASGDEFVEKQTNTSKKAKRPIKKPKFAKTFITKINKQIPADNKNEALDVKETLFSVKDLTDADKLLPSVLNLSESDSSEDESPQSQRKNNTSTTVNSTTFISTPDNDSENDKDNCAEYKDVWSNNIQDNSEDIAKKTFLELELHKANIEKTKESILTYSSKIDKEKESNVQDLLALGEDELSQSSNFKKKKIRRVRNDSDSDLDDWEEVQENKSIPQQGLQLIVDIPNSVCRKSKTIDVEMMMKRKINRVKKEYQVYMHKVHVLCWLGHGNYVSQVLNNQEVMAAALSLVPSKECYPGERVDMKYVEQITTWYKDKISLKQDKNENKFRPKAPPLKDILLAQVKSRVMTTKKYVVFIFVAMLRALGLQCRIMLNFVTLPIKPPSSELCSLSTKLKEDAKNTKNTVKPENKDKDKSKRNKSCKSISQVDGTNDYCIDNSCDFENIMQVDGNDGTSTVQKRRTRSKKVNIKEPENNEDVSPPKRSRNSASPRSTKSESGVPDNKKAAPQKRKRTNNSDDNNSEISKESGPNKDIVSIKKSPAKTTIKTQKVTKNNKLPLNNDTSSVNFEKLVVKESISPRKTRNQRNEINLADVKDNKTNVNKPPKITITKIKDDISSEYFSPNKSNETKKLSLSRKRSQTVNPVVDKTKNIQNNDAAIKPKTRTKSAPGTSIEKSKYFIENKNTDEKLPKKTRQQKQKLNEEDQRVSHRDLLKKKETPKNDVTGDLVDIIKNRIKEAKESTKKKLVKGKIKQESDDDSDYLLVEPKRPNSASDEDFKPMKISPKPSTSRKIDRRVISTDDDTPKNATDVWCEVYVEELEQWIAVDVIRGKAHCTDEIYKRATNPVIYVVGWDNNNYLKDVTRRYVPHWNTVTRKQRVEPTWWDTAVKPWLGPKNARDKEEDEYLDRMQLEAPLPKSIAEYKNHPLYALKRHLLKYEAIYPPDAATLGFVRGEPVYSRECVYVCRSRDTWLKEAKVVRLGEEPYKTVKARPKWDKLSNRIIQGDRPLEVFGPWQVDDYEPPVAENGIVPRNAYGNVELFKDCMLPKGTVHIKLPGLNRVAKKLNIDCAPAMTGFDFNGGWSHPVFDGFVVCKEYEEIITEAWVKDQEEQERKEIEKMEARVYGNWKKLIKGLMIREHLKLKYGFEDPTTSKNIKKTAKGPRLTVKKT